MNSTQLIWLFSWPILFIGQQIIFKSQYTTYSQVVSGILAGMVWIFVFVILDDMLNF